MNAPRVYAIDGVIPVVHSEAYVHPEAVLIGDVIIGPECYIGPGASLRGDFGQIVVGRGTNVQDNCTIHCFAGGATRMGEASNIGHGAVLHGCTIGDRVLVGMNSVIMDGAVIGDGCIVAALAFVRADMRVAPLSLVAGLPARVLRPLNELEITWARDGNQEYRTLVGRSHETLEAVAALTEPDIEGPRLHRTGAKPLYITRREAALRKTP
jgi:phenylacetic acid degradation protein